MQTPGCTIIPQMSHFNWLCGVKEGRHGDSQVVAHPEKGPDPRPVLTRYPAPERIARRAGHSSCGHGPRSCRRRRNGAPHRSRPRHRRSGVHRRSIRGSAVRRAQRIAGPRPDQLTIPSGISGGCRTSVAVLLKGITANVTTMAVAPPGQSTCSDSVGILTSANLQKALSSGTLNTAGITLYASAPIATFSRRISTATL
jgi:hypothetical protein